jgi:hypothetical protein
MKRAARKPRTSSKQTKKPPVRYSGPSTKTAKRKEKSRKIGREVMEETNCIFRREFHKAGFTAAKMAKEQAIMAYSDPADYAEIGEDGSLRLKQFQEIGEKRRAIKKIKEKTTIGESKDGSVIFKTSKVEYELWDKQQAHDFAADVLGIRADKKLKLETPGLESLLKEIHGKKA